MAADKLRAGGVIDAQRLFGEAAVHEKLALAAVAPDKPRTWGILAVSFASLLYKARDFERAEIELHALLGRPELLPDTRTQLRDLLEAVWDERTLPSGFSYSGEEIVIALRGGEVGAGTAPLDLVLEKATEVRSLVTRTVEMVAALPFRRRGLPSPKVSQYVRARATQAVAGSYRFTIKFASPSQPDLFPSASAPHPNAIAASLFECIAASVSSTAAGRMAIKRLMPDAQYRSAMLKLIRNVIPAGRSLREVELARVTKSASDGAIDRSVVLLTAESRLAVGKAIRENTPPTDPDEQQTVERGILRAVHLDDDWLLLDRPDGTRVKVEEATEAIDDVIGPLVNRRVVVKAVRTVRKGKLIYLFRDLEPDDVGDTESGKPALAPPMDST